MGSVGQDSAGAAQAEDTRAKKTVMDVADSMFFQGEKSKRRDGKGGQPEGEL